MDRLISGAGALSHLADRVVRAILRGGSFAHQPAGLLLAGLLGVGALVLVIVALDNAGDPTPRSLTAGEIPGGEYGDRVFANVTGGLPAGYVESYIDDNADGQQQPEERGQAWNYFLVDPTSHAGVTVKSRRAPSEVYTYTVSGVIVEDAAYVGQDVDTFRKGLAEFGLTLDPTHYIDATVDAAGTPYGLASAVPAVGTQVQIDASRGIDFLTVCSVDTNSDGVCADDEVDLYDIYVYDPISKRAIVVLTAESPEFAPASFSGVLRKSPAAVAEAIKFDGGTVSDIGVSVSPTYLLTDGDAPSDPVPMFVLAGLSLAVAALIVLGVVGGYLRFRPTGGTAAAAATLATGEGIPLKVTGTLRGRAGLIHVREAAADLKRFMLAPPNVPSGPAESTAATAATEPTEPTEPSVPTEVGVPTEPSVATEPSMTASTLIVERRGHPEGVAVGHGELTELRVGTVTPLRSNRAALRITAGTGPVLLSFDTLEARDRAAAELAAELAVESDLGSPATG